MRMMGIASMILMLLVMIVPCIVIQSGMVKIDKGHITLSDPGDSWASKKLHSVAQYVIKFLPKEGINAITGKHPDELFQQNASTEEAEPAQPLTYQQVARPTDLKSDEPVIKVVRANADGGQ